MFGGRENYSQVLCICNNGCISLKEIYGDIEGTDKGFSTIPYDILSSRYTHK